MNFRSKSSAQRCVLKSGLATERCVPAYKAVFEDGDAVELGFLEADVDEDVRWRRAAARAKMDEWEPHGAERWDSYLTACGAFLDCGLPNFVEERLDLGSFPAFWHETTWDGGHNWLLRPHSDMLDATFSSHKMRTLASFQDLYVRLAPYRDNAALGGGVFRNTAPAVFELLAALELHLTNDKAGGE